MTGRPLRAAWVRLGAYEKNAALVRRVVDEIWNAGDTDLADVLFSSNYVNHGGLIPDLVKGPEGIKFSVALYRTAFPGLHVRIDSLSSMEGDVHMRWTAQSKAAPMNVEHAFSGATRSSVAGGQIVESWTTWNSTIAMSRLGVFQPRHEETS